MRYLPVLLCLIVPAWAEEPPSPELKPYCTIIVPCEGRRDIGSINSIALSPDGKLIGCGGDDHVVRVYGRESKKLLHEFKGHEGWVRAVAFSPDSRYLVSGGDCSRLYVWDVQQGQAVKSIEVAPGRVRCICFCGEQRFATGDTCNTIRLWSFPEAKLVQKLVGHTGTIITLGYLPQSETLVSASYDTTIRMWLLTPRLDVPSVCVRVLPPLPVIVPK
jgi:WD40 repeat protein